MVDEIVTAEEEGTSLLTIQNGTDDLTEVLLGDGTCYQIVRDDHTGDWMIGSDEDPHVGQLWFEDESSAIKFVLRKVGLIEDADINIAPNRVDG